MGSRRNDSKSKRAEYFSACHGQPCVIFAPHFAPSPDRLIEKSIRPSDTGLPEIWYEFSGANFDVEIRSDGKAVLIEPA